MTIHNFMLPYIFLDKVFKYITFLKQKMHPYLLSPLYRMAVTVQ